MRQVTYTIESNGSLTGGVYRATLRGDTSDITRPGQFVNIKTEGDYLRRPISVCDAEGDVLTLVYRVVGSGTAKMSAWKPGNTADVLLELGNGYDLSPAGERPLLVGGGVGVPPLYYLAKELNKQGARPSVVLGFNTASERFYEEQFKAICDDVKVTTADGSYGIKGFVTDALPEECTQFYACGPLPMLKALYKGLPADGQFSLEERMGCGFGACMGCSIKTKTGNKRVCKDGPVFRKEDLLWED